MGGGILSLVACGAQDVYLTGNPQITFFKTIYRRYTNFALEAINQPIDSCRPGGTYNVLVQRNGDLATRTCLRVLLPAVRSDVLGDSNGKIAWVRRLGHALIRHVKIQIGGMDIDKHYGVWLDLWWELTNTAANERGYREMIGDVDELTTLRGRTRHECASEVLLPEYTLYIPFQFWFCRNYGLALPLIALQYHEVRFELHLAEVHNLFCWTGNCPPTLGNLTFRDTGILIDYVYLESAERRKYAQVGHEYLIEQVQFTGAENVNADQRSVTTNHNVKLTFNHPTKELVWALRVGAFSGEGSTSSFSSGRNRFLSYANTEQLWNTEGLSDAAKNLAEGCVFINPEGVCSDDSDQRVQLPNGLFIHRCSESSNPGFNVGQRVSVRVVNRRVEGLRDDCDFDETNEHNIHVWCYDTPHLSSSFNLLSTSSGFDLFEGVESAEVVVYHTDGHLDSVRIECVEVRHRLDLTDLSVPVGDYAVDNRSRESRRFCVHRDVNVSQPNNYGLRLDGMGNPVHSAKLQLNGHDRFSLQKGSYFNYYQPHNHHTHTPCDGVNVYSFALNPENHQPSGTTNLSRIDNCILQLTLKDSLREDRRLKLDIGSDSRLYIFAFSYNVLRVLSGMGGLAYSN
jgi:hypothetical protein